jgi:hypothetical protein
MEMEGRFGELILVDLGEEKCEFDLGIVGYGETVTANFSMNAQNLGNETLS